MAKPFDTDFCRAMLQAARGVAEDMQGFVLGYVQSDEASFLLQDDAKLDTEPWFGKDLSKIVSLSAATMSVCFTLALGRVATFDARAFVLPPGEVANYFLWRARDWARNSLTMYAQAHFPHKQLHGKGTPEMHEMLHGIGRNWTTDLTDSERNGTFLLPDRRRVDVHPTYASVLSALEEAYALAYPKDAPDGL
jgi:tRNA(His) 5'-end guanylyltransferase